MLSLSVKEGWGYWHLNISVVLKEGRRKVAFELGCVYQGGMGAVAPCLSYLVVCKGQGSRLALAYRQWAETSTLAVGRQVGSELPSAHRNWHTGTAFAMQRNSSYMQRMLD